ncbi:hypothetical protein D9M72_174080 [compost metagenome]
MPQPITLSRLSTLLLALAAATPGWAAVTAEEAAKLKSELTPLGAERAASKDGAIPAWTGGYTTVSASYKAGTPRPDPFAADKPVYSITAANMAQHADKLSDGQQALLKKYPSYRIDVYPTRRTAAAPEWVYDNTLKNATRAKTANNGDTVVGAYGGIPFPIPKSGKEAMWNHLLRWAGEAALFEGSTWSSSGGRVALAATIRSEINYPYYYKDGTPQKFAGEYWYNYQVTLEPSFKAGETILVRDPVDQVGMNRQAWQYLVGQRRVRKAPNLAYDTPDPTTSGNAFMDEVTLFLGAMDRFEFKIVGKKELLIPYNLNSFIQKKPQDVVGGNHLNPDPMRWELHRVWVVEAELAAGKRHAVPKRRYYLDEDTWAVSLYDGWDAQGQLWRTGLALPFLAPEIPAVISANFVTMDLLKGSYQAAIVNGNAAQWEARAPYPETNFTPESVAARGVR